MGNKSPRELAEKYSKGKTEEQMIAEQDALEEEYATISSELEQALEDFSKQTDKLIDPKTKKALAVVRRPTSEQFRRVVPPEIARYRKHPEKIPYELALKYEDNMYKLMEELIEVPRRSAKEWRKTTGAKFMALFQSHLVNLNEKVREESENFLPQNLDSRS